MSTSLFWFEFWGLMMIITGIFLMIHIVYMDHFHNRRINRLCDDCFYRLYYGIYRRAPHRRDLNVHWMETYVPNVCTCCSFKACTYNH